MNAEYYLRCGESMRLKNLGSKEEFVIDNLKDLKKVIKS